MTTPAQADAGEPQHTKCREPLQHHQQQDQQPPADLVLRVVLGCDPSSTSSSRVLRPFHTVCSEGHAAALRTIRHVHLGRCVELGVPPERQLCALAAADQATALTIFSSQIGGLVACLTQQQQQQEEEETQQQLEGVQQGLEDLVINSTAPADVTTSSSSSGGGGVAAAATSHPAMPTPKPRGPSLAQLTVVGTVTQDSIRQVEQLLDLLPGTQQLQQLALAHVCYDRMWGVFSNLPRHLVSEAPMRFKPQGASSDPPQQRQGPTIDISSSSSSRPDGSLAGADSTSWRTSCQSLAVITSFPALEMDDLQPLLAPLQQLRVLFLAGVLVTRLPEYAISLRPLRALYITATSSYNDDAILACAAGLTNLRHLGLSGCDPPLRNMPDLGNLVHLTSLHFSYQRVTGGRLEGVRGATALRTLEMSNTKGLPHCHWGPLGASPHWYLWLGDDHMVALPTAISQLTGLQQLRVGGRALAVLPATLTALVQLRRLTLTSLKLKSLPEEIVALTRLEALTFRVLPRQSPAVEAFLAEREVEGWHPVLAQADCVW